MTPENKEGVWGAPVETATRQERRREARNCMAFYQWLVGLWMEIFVQGIYSQNLGDFWIFEMLPVVRWNSKSVAWTRPDNKDFRPIRNLVRISMLLIY